VWDSRGNKDTFHCDADTAAPPDAETILQQLFESRCHDTSFDVQELSFDV